MGLGAAAIGIGAAAADIAASAGAAIAAGAAAIGSAVGGALGGITLAGVAEGAGIGAGIGGLTSAIEGKPILSGMLQGGTVGGLTAGAGEFLAPAVGGTAAGILGGAGSGALGSAMFGGSPLMGAVTGGAAGGIAGATGAYDAPSVGTGASTAGTDVGGGVTEAGGLGSVIGGPLATQSGSLASGAALDGQAALGDATNLPGTAPAVATPATAGPGPSAVANTAPAGVVGNGGDVTAGATELAPTDASALADQQALTSGGTGSTGLVMNADGAAAPDSGGQGGWTIGQAQSNDPNLMPLPPVPPSLDASGNPITSGGDLVYPSQADALAAGQQAANEAGVAPSPGNSIAAAFDNPTLGTVGTALSNNSNVLMPAAGLALNAGKTLLTPGVNQTAVTNTLQSQAATLGQQGQQLQSYLQTGTLPAGVQQSINSATASAKAAIRSQYAAHGMSGSSAEAQDLAAVDQRASAQGAQIATQLLQQGVSETQLSDQIYTALLNQSIQQDNQLSTAISNFASSMVPRSPSIVIQGSGG